MTFFHFFESRDNQISKEAFKDVNLNDFNVDVNKLVENPSLVKQDFTIAEQ